ncbi:serine/threonine-protein kinase/endoribonuclease IRE1a-like [Rutidosis leptorrhynchoides]|uniref:serine/threonine-protein kinase/endoribonuclease IRE1a-like n=1 Tax=Rutidosis leptorrhynchoides TaxID=125765 RepID=UPI003A99B765
MGSNGTIIYQGKYDGRNVAVKRIVKEYKDVAIKETDNLTTSDSHTNVVRYFGREYDQDFIYLAMERCNCSLYDLIQIYLDAFKDDAADDTREARVIPDHKISLDLIKVLWYPNGNPSPILLKLLRDIVSGLVHLHELGIIHRDLKPNNVLILNQYKSLCVKLSDMGISRRLDENMSSLGDQATGCGSSGWKAPEQLGHGRQTKAMDMFSLGCVIFYCITCGRHPFGEPFERDDNITKGQFDLSSVEHIPEAVDLITQLLKPISKLSDRPKASEVLQHPLFWNAETRTSFLKEASDRVIMEYGASKSVILTSLETRASIVLRGEGWDKKVNGLLINHLVQHRHGKGYDYNKVEQLLRAIRNTLNHYKELPSPIQVVLGTSPDGVDDYFASRFPEFLMEVYKVMYSNCITEDWFRRYL